MKYIELTFLDGDKVYVSVDQIISFYDDGGTFVALQTDKKGCMGYYVKETSSEILDKIILN